MTNAVGSARIGGRAPGAPPPLGSATEPRPNKNSALFRNHLDGDDTVIQDTVYQFEEKASFFKVTSLTVWITVRKSV